MNEYVFMCIVFTMLRTSQDAPTHAHTNTHTHTHIPVSAKKTLVALVIP